MRNLRRVFSKLMPKEEFRVKHEEALKHVFEKEQEGKERELDDAIPYKQSYEIVQETPKQVSVFGQSSEEDPQPFFLDDIESTQYTYVPKSHLVFDEKGYYKVFQSSGNLLSRFKIRYCWKVIFPIIGAVVVTVQPFLYGTAYMLLSWAIPACIYSRGKLVKSIWLDKSGKKIKVDFYFARSKELSIDKLKLPSGNSHMFWSVYEFPDDLYTYAENSKLERVAFSKKMGYWKFMLLPKFPSFVNREVLINALNGIFIETEPEQQAAEEFSDRYLVLYSKK